MISVPVPAFYDLLVLSVVTQTWPLYGSRRVSLVLVCVYGLTHRLSSLMAPMLGEALWELERLNAVEFVVDGNEIEVMRGLATVGGTLRTLAQVFSLESYEGHPDIWEGFHGNLEAVLTNAGVHEYREY